MGEIADMVVNGFLCQECGSHIDFEETGYPRSCEDCVKKLVTVCQPITSKKKELYKVIISRKDELLNE